MAATPLNLKRRIRYFITGRGNLLGIPLRLLIALRYFKRLPRQIIRWAFTSKEIANFTYDLSPLNYLHLLAFVAEVSGHPIDEVEKYAHEVSVPHSGRRLGWYCLIRVIKPKVVVETGVDRGLGGLVITSALEANAAEGYRGEYFGIDHDPRAGELLRSTPIIVMDSHEALRHFDKPIDIFIHDSEHTKEHESGEYKIIEPLLHPDSFVLSDNAHVTDCLYEFARRTGRRFLFFSEKPHNHWYPGAGIGAAFSSAIHKPPG